MAEQTKKRGFFNRRKKQAPKVRHNYAFIDAQNLNLGTQRVGWKMDWKKFRLFLKEQHDVEKAYMFIGYLPDNEGLYTQMKEAGYLVVLKPTVDMYMTEKELKDEKHITKGNVDAELVMYAVKEIRNYKKAVVVSGDGDFFSLIEYLDGKDKLLHIMTPNARYSSLLKPFEKYVMRLDSKRRELSYGPVRRSRSKQHSKQHAGKTKQQKSARSTKI